MKNTLRKSYLLIIVLLLNMYISGCQDKAISKEENSNEYTQNIEINQKNAEAINVEEKNINVADIQEEKIGAKIENVSTFYISDIWISYEELDKNKNVMSTQDIFLDLTLSPNEIALATLSYKEHTDTIKIVSYRYESGNKVVKVDLTDKVINISDNKSTIEDSKKYEILTISQIHKKNESKDTSVYNIKVKNSSKRDIGNVGLIIGELKNNEYIAINHLAPHNVLKADEEMDIDITTTLEADKLDVIGYTYDDIKAKANVSVELKSQRAKINK